LVITAKIADFITESENIHTGS